MSHKYFKVVGKCAAILLMASALSWSSATFAQVIPGPANASRIPNEIQNGNWPPEAPVHVQRSPVEETPVPAIAVPAAAAKIMFTLQEVDLTGVTVYKPAKLKALWAKDLGQRISVLRLYEIAEAITAQYRKDGYILSRAFVPAQTIGGGLAKISVVEGYIRDVRFEGTMPSSYLLEQARGKLMSDRPLRVKTVERQMLLLNDLPGTDFRAILKPLPANIATRDAMDAATGDVRVLPHAAEETTGVKIREQSGKIVIKNITKAPDMTKPLAGLSGLPSGGCNTAINVTAYISSKSTGKTSSAGRKLGQVIYLAADDDSAGTVAHELKMAGAKTQSCNIVETIKDGGPLSQVKHGSKLEHDLNAVREMIRKNKDTELIVMDPVEAYFSDLKDKNADIRTVLAPLAQIAARNNTPILAVTRARPVKKTEPVFWPKVNPAVFPVEPARDGGVLLVIDGKPRNRVQALLSVDNAESRFLGPWLVGAKLSLQRGFLPYEQTDLSFNATPGSNELRYVNLTHTIPLTADGLKLSFNGGVTKGLPGYTLEKDGINSVTQTLGAALSWDAVRARTQNLRFSFGLDSMNARTDSLGTPLSDDRTRALKLQGHYDEQNSYRGSSTFDMTLSHGLETLGASHPGDELLSRANGRPDYTILSTQDYRFQKLNETWNAMIGFAGQASDSALLSEQQFGYGGQAFGRGYDPSQIVGDSGIAGTAELRYDGMKTLDGMKLLAGGHLQPFGFYDIGEVWNRDPGQPFRQSGASAGAGIRLNLPLGTNASFLIAQPLTLRETDPQYGNGKEPRFVFSLSQAL